MEIKVVHDLGWCEAGSLPQIEYTENRDRCWMICFHALSLNFYLISQSKGQRRLWCRIELLARYSLSLPSFASLKMLFVWWVRDGIFLDECMRLNSPENNQHWVMNTFLMLRTKIYQFSFLSPFNALMFFSGIINTDSIPTSLIMMLTKFLLRHPMFSLKVNQISTFSGSTKIQESFIIIISFLYYSSILFYYSFRH